MTILVNMLRQRIGLRREVMLRFSKLDERSLQRIEKETQQPKPGAFEMLMKAISLPMEGFIYPLLEIISMETIIKCERLSQLLDLGDTAESETLFSELEETLGFDDGIYRQFLLSKKARLFELQGKPSSQILALTEEGLSITYDNYNDDEIGDNVLVLEEPEMIHLRARQHRDAGNHNTAIKILNCIYSGLTKLPISDKENERHLAPVLLSLSGCLLLAGDHSGAIKVCEIGAGYSALRRQGRYNPEFELIRARALRGLDRMDECTKPLQHAYTGYLLLSNAERANAVLAEAREDFGVELVLHDVDEIEIPQHQRIPFFRGDPVECSSIGSMLKALRESIDLSQEQLCRGICNKSTLSLMERGINPGKIWNLEAIMQRLGRDIGLYDNFFMTKKDFVTIQLRNRINILIIDRRNEEAAKLLEDFERLPHISDFAVLKQFLKLAKASILYGNDSISPIEFEDMLLDALKTTLPDFDEYNLSDTPLSYTELLIINRYAYLLGVTEKPSRANEIYEQLRLNLNVRYVDETEKVRMYPSIMLNYSTFLEKSGDCNKALEIIAEAENFERSHGNLYDLPLLLFNKGCNYHSLGDISRSKPLFILAYYGASMFENYGQSVYVEAIKEEIKGLLGIDLP